MKIYNPAFIFSRCKKERSQESINPISNVHTNTFKEFNSFITSCR